MLADIREILIISTSYDSPGFMSLLEDGSAYVVEFTYAEQPSSDGLAQAFTIGKNFIGDDSACHIHGGNTCFGSSFTLMPSNAATAVEEENKATDSGYCAVIPSAM